MVAVVLMNTNLPVETLDLLHKPLNMSSQEPFMIQARCGPSRDREVDT